MAVVINGTTGISGTDGSASTPALRGSDTNTGVYYGTDVVSIATNGTEQVKVDSGGVLNANGDVKLATAAKKILNSSGNPILQQTGSVLQVVQGTTATQVTTTSTAYVDTGLSATITPTSATSKILIMVSQNAGSNRTTTTNATGFGIRIVRGSTPVFIPAEEASGSNPDDIFITAPGSTSVTQQTRVCINYLDSPATTSAITYKTQGAVFTTQNCTFQYTSVTGSTSTIILMEIAA